MRDVKNNPIGVRLKSAQRAGLQRLADKYGVEMVDVLRWAIDALLQYCEAHEGRLVLPVDFNESFTTFPAAQASKKKKAKAA